MLNQFKKNKYFSQYGEDGIVEEILKRLKQNIDLDNWCSEFGAWDGVHLSNTCYFIKRKNFRAILIEGDKKKTKILRKNFSEKKVYCINKFVNFEGPNSLDSIYSNFDIPLNFDFLSIDIDGADYHVFESLKNYRPKIICIEFNPKIPNDVDFVQLKDMKIKQGNSASAIIKLANSKNYGLVACTECNLILVDKKIIKYVIKSEPSLDLINPNKLSPTYIFPGYDGTILSNRRFITLNWHGIPVPINEKLQFLPKFLRKFYSDYGLFDKLLMLLLVLLKIPKIIIEYRYQAFSRLKEIFKKNK